ncbi:MAG TPA: radical SAM protein [Firmicutes bacterium]|nr:radical SAM protein [Bacillota bacterium]
MSQNQNYIQLMNQSIGRLFKDALTISCKEDLSQAFFLLQTIFRQRKAAILRHKWQKKGIGVPPFMILSITHQCNLRCKGCYAQAHHHSSDTELSTGRLREIIAEARSLGIGISLLAGGEPLIRPEILEIAAGFPEIIFPVFSNGLLINDKLIGFFKKHKNIVPVISIEGDAEDTDGRRGAGVSQKLNQILPLLQDNHIFYGVSLTVTRMNFKTITGEPFVKDLHQHGCRLFFYVEYVPVKETTADWVLSEQQRKELLQATQRMRLQFPSLFIAFPGDEEQFGGCLAAGRGFIHISPDGNLEPCPFSPYSDTNLNKVSLKDALKSRLLETIRNSHDRLKETTGGCALWENREWVNSLLKETQNE